MKFYILESRPSPIVQATEYNKQLTCPRPTTLYSQASPNVQASGDIEQSKSSESTHQLQRYIRVNRPVSRNTAWTGLPNSTAVWPTQHPARKFSLDGSMNRTARRKCLDCLIRT